jgi:hypothetical protein
MLFLFSVSALARNEFNMAFDRLGDSITLESGRARSLEFLAACPTAGPFAATTHHNVEVALQPERSYTYAAVSRRYMLLEGWRYAGAAESKLLDKIASDNQKLFTTHDEDEARKIVDKYSVTELLLEPQETLGFDAEKCGWLHRLDNSGRMIIYQVDRSDAGSLSTTVLATVATDGGVQGRAPSPGQ